MLKKLISFSILCCLFSGVYSYSQDNGTLVSGSPYSVYGIGNLVNQGSAYNKSMGGVGIANRNKRFVNYINPAAISSRDSLAFLMDISIVAEDKIFTQNGVNSLYNLLNINNIAFSLPLYKKSAFVMGLSPYSGVGYNFFANVEDEDVIARTKDIYRSSSGEGGLYSLFAGPSMTFFDRLSFGVQGIYYFGSINKKSEIVFMNEKYKSLVNLTNLNLHAFGAKIGVQYEQKINDKSIIFGATYSTGARLRGTVNKHETTRFHSRIDTLSIVMEQLGKESKPYLPGEYGLGLAFKQGDKFSMEFNYLFSDWRKSGFDNTLGFSNNGEEIFRQSFGYSCRFGVEYLPNKSDIRYYLKRCSYRAGFYYNKNYYTVNNVGINSFGVTFGMTLPVVKWFNGISIGVSLGKNGTMKNNLVREYNASFMLGFNINEIWFLKPRYE